MSTIQDKLSAALTSKRNIKTAIEEKGVSVTDFASYADAIRNIKGGGEGHSPMRFSAEFDQPPYFLYGLNIFGSSAFDVKKLTICGFETLVYFSLNDSYSNVSDLTIDRRTYDYYTNSEFIVLIGSNVHNGNLRLEGEWSEIPEELLDAFVGWELYINGEHIGTIIPESSGYYYTIEEKEEFDLSQFKKITYVTNDCQYYNGKHMYPFYPDVKRIVSIRSSDGAIVELDPTTIVDPSGLSYRYWWDYEAAGWDYHDYENTIYVQYEY